MANFTGACCEGLIWYAISFCQLKSILNSTYGNYRKSLQLCFMLVQVQHTSNHVKTAFMNAFMLTQVYFRDIPVSIIMPLLNRKKPTS